MIRTGLRLVIPERHYGRIAPRSGLALKGIDVAGGVIGQCARACARARVVFFVCCYNEVGGFFWTDGDFKGEMRVILVNTTADAFEVRTGDRIAQLILEQCSTPEIVEISDVGESERGEAGFGSTGV